MTCEPRFSDRPIDFVREVAAEPMPGESTEVPQ
jgi:hypothetical protein